MTQAHEFSTKFPPRNRIVREGLSVIDISIRGASSEFRTTPNDLAGLVLEELQLGAPLGVSDISGQPGYAYETNEVSLVLALDELVRLALRNLRREEYFVLAEKFGVFYEMHNDFYNEQTGLALQGRVSLRESASFVHRVLRGEALEQEMEQAVEAWHQSGGHGKPLHTYLGLTWAEYSAWVRDPASLKQVLQQLITNTYP